jgi:hypothetical protein
MDRNYRSEYDNHQSSTKSKKDRAARNKARREALRDGRVSKGDDKDMGHKKALRSGGSRDTSNTKIQTRTSNRSDNGHKPGEKQKRHK